MRINAKESLVGYPMADNALQNMFSDADNAYLTKPLH